RVPSGELASAVIADVDWHTFIDIFSARRRVYRDEDDARGVPPLLAMLAAELADDPADPESDEPANTDDRSRGALRVETAKWPVNQRMPRLKQAIRAIVARCLGHGSASQIAERVSLFEQGMDSLIAMELRRQLESQLEITLPATLAFEYPTVDKLTGMVATAVFTANGEQVSAADQDRAAGLDAAQVDEPASSIPRPERETQLDDELAELERLLHGGPGQ
ncbi:MAG: acyl carrier protein, partial [Myxococcota bacterium]